MFYSGFARFVILYGFYLSVAALFYATQNKSFPGFMEEFQPTSIDQSETIGGLVAVAVAAFFTPKRVI